MTDGRRGDAAFNSRFAEALVARHRQEGSEFGKFSSVHGN
jgi:hypothetical protein